MYKDKLNYKLLNLLIIAAIFYIAIMTSNYWAAVILKAFKLVLPFIIAFIISYALYPLVRLLERKGVNKKLATTTVVLGVLFIIIGLVSLTVPLLYDQLINLSNNIRALIIDLSTKFGIDISQYQDQINASLNTVISGLGTYISTGFWNVVTRTADFFTKIIIVAIVSVYFLSDMENIRNNIKIYIKKKRRKLFKLLKEIDNELGNWLEGLLIFMIVQFFEYSFLFWIVGHPNWLLLGLLASLTTVIPYFGGWITNIIAVILASVVSTKLFIATLVICLIFPNIDGYIISPNIYGKKTNVKPLWTIFAVAVMGGLFGIFGILISLPTFLILRSVYKYIKEEDILKLEVK